MDKYRLPGGIIDPNTPFGPEDKSNNAQDWTGTNGTVPASISPAMDEDWCSWDSGCGNKNPEDGVC